MRKPSRLLVPAALALLALLALAVGPFVGVEERRIVRPSGAARAEVADGGRAASTNTVAELPVSPQTVAPKPRPAAAQNPHGTRRAARHCSEPAACDAHEASAGQACCSSGGGQPGHGTFEAAVSDC
jgi:hypothetical protein